MTAAPCSSAGATTSMAVVAYLTAKISSISSSGITLPPTRTLPGAVPAAMRAPPSDHTAHIAAATVSPQAASGNPSSPNLRAISSRATGSMMAGMMKSFFSVVSRSRRATTPRATSRARISQT